jgi:hypothetical protein
MQNLVVWLLVAFFVGVLVEWLLEIFFFRNTFAKTKVGSKTTLFSACFRV